MAWWLAYEELYGNMDKAYPIKENVMSDITFRTDGYPGSIEESQSVNLDSGPSAIRFGDPDQQVAHTTFSDDPYPTVGMVDDAYAYHYPPTEHILGTEMGATKPQPDLDNPVPQKYEEDKGLEDLKSYVTSTYQGHYTNKGSNVQTLDLIHSVGDAESFCRSNAIKYLSRYDKKGQAKKDILKAMHYCLLLYYFSGNTQEPDYTNARYETF